jgi:hypothetical protein
VLCASLAVPEGPELVEGAPARADEAARHRALEPRPDRGQLAPEVGAGANGSLLLVLA